MYKNFFINAILIILISSSILAEEIFKGRPITNLLSMPTGYTLQGGEFKLGIGPIEYGLTDRLQVGTDILLSSIGKQYNAMVKMTLSESMNMSLSTGIRLDYHKDIMISPLLSYSKIISSKLNVHFAGQVSISTGKEEDDKEEIKSTFKGTSIYTGMDYNLSNITKLLSDVGYDFNYKGIRLGGGVLFGWKEFRLMFGLTYYKSPTVHTGYTYPLGLWFRFK